MNRREAIAGMTQKACILFEWDGKNYSIVKDLPFVPYKDLLIYGVGLDLKVIVAAWVIDDGLWQLECECRGMKEQWLHHYAPHLA